MFSLPELAETVSNLAPTYNENKSSILRRRKLKEKDEESSAEEAEPETRLPRARRRQSNTVQIRADSLNRLYRALKDLQHAGSVNELTQSEDEPDKYYLKKVIEFDLRFNLTKILGRVFSTD